MPLEELLSSRKGEAAALATAVCWSLTPFFFTAASRRIGAFSSNVIRLVLASVFLTTAVLLTRSFHPVPWKQGALLAASGFVGLTLGDAALFEAFMILGPRRVSLLGAVAPIVVAVLSLPLLGETMSFVGVAGMGLTLGGVAWVVAERSGDGEITGSAVRGVVMGVLAAVGQGLGALLAKAGLGNAVPGTLLGDLADSGAPAQSVSPLLGTLFRMLAGCGGMLLWTMLRGRGGEVARGAGDRRALTLLVGGAICGPFVGVWLSLTAFKYTRETAVAQTIMAISPVLVIVIARAVHGDRPSPRTWIGSVTAVLGVAMLALRAEIARAFSG